MKKFLVLFILVLCLCGCGTKSGLKSITCSEKDEILKGNSNAMLIDVRSEEEYNEGHLDGAINMPYDKVVEELSVYGIINMDVPLIVYCKSGGRSSEAADALVDAGYNNVYDLGAMSNCDN